MKPKEVEKLINHSTNIAISDIRIRAEIRRLDRVAQTIQTSQADTNIADMFNSIVDIELICESMINTIGDMRIILNKHIDKIVKHK